MVMGSYVVIIICNVPAYAGILHKRYVAARMRPGLASGLNCTGVLPMVGRSHTLGSDQDWHRNGTL